jgi:N-acetylmuramoyl-L-alanine amidase
MKRYLILLFSALFGLAQIAPAADPGAGKKGSQKAPQSARQPQQKAPKSFRPPQQKAPQSFRPPQQKAPQSFRPAPQRITQPPAAVKKSPNISPPISRPANPQFQKDQRTRTAPNVANQRVQKPAVNPAVNPAVVAQPPKRYQNNGNIAAQRNWQNQNQGKFAPGQTRPGWNRNRQSASLSFSDAYNRRQRGHHDRNWWTSRYGTNIILFGSGYYYRDSGYWYPAYGYDRAYNTYEYDRPIYGYNNLPPGQVVANVQSALQQLGYYQGPIDGSIGPVTRDALQRYQGDNGLEVTAAIDEPTLAALGLI